MEDKIFLLLKLTIKTSYKDLQHAIKELQSKTELNVSSTKNVKVLKIEIMQLKTKTL